MEKLKAKHDHKLTDILKVAIFAIFLMFPFLVYAPNALYYGVNENAVNNTATQVDIQYKYQSNEVNNLDDLIEGNIYEVNNFYVSENLTYPNMVISMLNFEGLDILYLDEVETTDMYFIGDFNSNYDIATLYITHNSLYAELKYSNLKIYNDVTFYWERISFDKLIFIYSVNDLDFENYCFDNNIVISKTDYNLIESVEVQENVEQTITESMNKAWQKMWETPMFNWTSQSVLKQGLDNFTGVFGVSNTSYFTNLIVYELIMVAIYIVIDIVITMFKWLTHLIGEK